jgi:hypothetical protein
MIHRSGRRKNSLLLAVTPALLLFLAACSSGKDQGAPREITAKSAGGSAGVGPHIISDSKAQPGSGKYGGQKVVLRDRVLVVNNATLQAGGSEGSASIELDLSVQSTGAKGIENQAGFFRLIGPEGDTFGNQYNSSDSFYGAIAAHESRRGHVSFKVPEAATSTLRLLYRPEVPSETAIVPLKIG